MTAAELARISAHVAQLAADLIRSGPSVAEVLSTKSSEVDVVTEMDLAVEALIRRELARLRPKDGYLGEEGGRESSASGITWVVDPIDGTVNYLYGLGGYAVSVAAVSGPPDPAQWEVLAGTVHSVVDDQVWTAWLGGGAYLNGEPIHGPRERPLATSLVATGFGYQVSQRAKQGQIVARVLTACRDIRRRGVAAADICTVASGGVDLYYERALNPWDMAAAAIVATEAGLQVTGLRGNKAGADMVVVGRGENRADLIALLEELAADSDDL